MLPVFGRRWVALGMFYHGSNAGFLWAPVQCMCSQHDLLPEIGGCWRELLAGVLAAVAPAGEGAAASGGISVDY
jgi:hypothetical protein